MKGPTWLEKAKVNTLFKFPVPRSFARMRFPGGGKVCGEENAMQLDAHVTDFLTKPSLGCRLAIQRLVISNRIMRPHSHPTTVGYYGVLPTSKS